VTTMSTTTTRTMLVVGGGACCNELFLWPSKTDGDVNDVIVQEGFGFVFYGLVSRRAF
jgi:hypothetical protein